MPCGLLKVVTGQKVLPVRCAGAYVPGGRFSHVSSAIMSVATAKASGVTTVIACSPPYGDTQMIHPATLYVRSMVVNHHDANANRTRTNTMAPASDRTNFPWSNLESRSVRGDIAQLARRPN